MNVKQIQEEIDCDNTFSNYSIEKLELLAVGLKGFVKLIEATILVRKGKEGALNMLSKAWSKVAKITAEIEELE